MSDTLEPNRPTHPTRNSLHRGSAGPLAVTRSRAMRPSRRTKVQVDQPFGSAYGLMYLTIQRGRDECGTWLTAEQVHELAAVLTGQCTDTTTVSFEIALNATVEERSVIQLSCRAHDDGASIAIHHGATSIGLWLPAQRRSALAAGLARLAVQQPGHPPRHRASGQKDIRQTYTSHESGVSTAPGRPT